MCHLLMSWHIRYSVTHHRNQLGKRQRVIITTPADRFPPALRLSYFSQVPNARGFIKLASGNALLEIKAERCFQPLSMEWIWCSQEQEKSSSRAQQHGSLLIQSNLMCQVFFFSEVKFTPWFSVHFDHIPTDWCGNVPAGIVIWVHVLYFSLLLSANIC